MSRGNGKISRDTSFSSYAIEEPSWAQDYLSAVEKYSVRSRKEDANLFDQINQILGNSKSKFSSVEEAVLDMQKRTGLLDFLEKKANEESMFDKFPDLKDFIKNKVELFPGSAIQAINEMILQEPKYKNSIPPGEHLPEDVENYINKLKSETTPEDHNHIADGRIDLEFDTNTIKDNDPLNGMTPTSF